MSNILENDNYTPENNDKIVNKEDLESAKNELKQYVNENTIKAGFIYIQLRGTQTPDQIFKTSGKWKDISSTYAGEFFRAVGGNSASFGSKQKEGLPNISGVLKYAVLFKNDRDYSSSGAFTHYAFEYGQYSTGSNMNVGHLHFNAYNSNTIYGDSTNVTPYNSAVRIWKKIA